MKLSDLFEERLISIEPEDIEIENGIMIPHQFPNKVNNFTSVELKHLISLENCPQEIEGFFICSYTSITSLKYCPKKVKYTFYCEDTKITSLEYAPLKCNKIVCSKNNIKSLQGIGRKYLKECKAIYLPDTIKSNILGLCLVNKLEDIRIFDDSDKWITNGPLYEAIEIIEKHLQTDGDECMEQLIQNGYKDYAKF